MEHIKFFLDIFRTHNVFLYIVCITTASLTYNLFGAADLTGYTRLNSEYKNYTGLVFFISAITILVLCFVSLKNFIKSIYENISSSKDYNEGLKRKIVDLTDKEKAVLLQYLMQQSETIWLPHSSQEVTELLNSGLIYIANNTSRITTSGYAFLMKLPSENLSLLVAYHPDVFSINYKKEIVEKLIQHHTPRSVINVIQSNRLHGY